MKTTDLLGDPMIRRRETMIRYNQEAGIGFSSRVALYQICPFFFNNNVQKKIFGQFF